jgi:hypothetical protein
VSHGQPFSSRLRLAWPPCLLPHTTPLFLPPPPTGQYTPLFDPPLTYVTTLLPLLFVLAVTMGKEAVEDVKRHLADWETNSRPAEVWGGQWGKSGLTVTGLHHPLSQHLFNAPPNEIQCF